jgi:hypothetical protein
VSLDIGDVLNRRSDLSTFVVHLTRDSNGTSAADKLTKIIQDRRLVAGSPMGWVSNEDVPDDPEKQSQRVVCFSEVPLEHVYSLVADIAGRKVALKPYGLALTKIKARRLGVNPIWYVDCTPGRDWEVALALDALRDEAKKGGAFHHSASAKILPFIDRMGSGWSGGGQREFWWEREWRHAGDLSLDKLGRVTLWLCPEDEIDQFRETMKGTKFPGASKAHFIDPRWGLERIIAHLAGDDDVSPFNAR